MPGLGEGKGPWRLGVSSRTFCIQCGTGLYRADKGKGERGPTDYEARRSPPGESDAGWSRSDIRAQYNRLGQGP